MSTPPHMISTLAFPSPPIHPMSKGTYPSLQIFPTLNCCQVSICKLFGKYETQLKVFWSSQDQCNQKLLLQLENPNFEVFGLLSYRRLLCPLYQIFPPLNCLPISLLTIKSYSHIQEACIDFLSFILPVPLKIIKLFLCSS